MRVTVAATPQSCGAEITAPASQGGKVVEKVARAQDQSEVRGPPTLPRTPVRATASSPHSIGTEACPGSRVEVVEKDAQVQSEMCPMSLEAIVDTSDQVEGHDAIFCEGDSCQAWYHRWCAGVSKERYALLSVSDAPFFCPCCVMEHQNRAIVALQDTVKTLATQLSELQVKCNEVLPLAAQPTDATEQSSDSSDSAEQPWTVVKGKGTWSKVVSNKKGKGKGKGKGESTGNEKGKANNASITGTVPKGHGPARPASDGTGPSRHSLDEPNTEGNGQTHPNSKLPSSKKRIPVENARKVWGTLRSTTCPVIINAIKQLTSAPLGARLTVRRKFKTSQNGTIKKWWFVVRGDKSDTELLEKEWPKIALQTGWKLEPVFCFDEATITDSSTSTDVSASPTPSSNSSPAVDSINAPQSSQD